MKMISPTASVRDRIRFGQKLRHRLKRSDHAQWNPKRRRKTPLDIILNSNRKRIPELVPVKMARMAVSPFGFFRGCVPVMAADLATQANTGIEVQICGDAHVRNLGAYAGLDGRLIFDLNDFDETIPAPWEWDLKRLATSLVLVGREAQNSDAICREAVLACAANYRRKMGEFCAMPSIELAKYRIRRQFDCTPGASVVQRAERATPLHSLAKLTVGRGKQRKFRELKPVLTTLSRTKAARVIGALKDYRATLAPSSQHLLSFYQPIAVAFKIVGTGSVATQDYVVLHLSGAGPADPLFLQVKQALPSAYAPYVRLPESAINQGERVVRGQRMLQFQSDLLLGWTSFGGSDYLVRQLNDHKGSVQNDDLRGPALTEYAVMCAEVLARGHARSGDPAVLSGYLGANDRWDRALEKFAVAYADQTIQDYEAFLKACKRGKIMVSKRDS